MAQPEGAPPVTRSIEEMGERLGREHKTLRGVRQWVGEALDPNHAGLVGVGEFLCVWMRGWDIVGRDKPGKPALADPGAEEPPLEAQQVAAVAACVAARLLKREWDMELLDPRGEEEKKRERLWYGRTAEWRWDPACKPPLPDGAGHAAPAAAAATFQFTHTLLVSLRIMFEEYQDLEGGGIRFGAVSAYLTRVAASASLGKYFPLTPADLTLILDALVKHVRHLLPTGPEWVEPTFPFPTILSLMLKHATPDPQQDALLAHFNEGICVFRELLEAERHLRGAAADGTAPVDVYHNLLPVRVLIAALAKHAGRFFSDAAPRGVHQAW